LVGGRCAQNTASVDAADDGDADLAEDMGHLCFAKARSVVFERKLAFGVVDGEAAEAVGVGEFAERAELRVSKSRLQFKSCFEECHRKSIAERLRVAEAKSALCRNVSVEKTQNQMEKAGARSLLGDCRCHGCDGSRCK
jgi:hypothetical protein